MAGKRSAGLLLYRSVDGRVEVLIGHMGGPLWARKDSAGWSIPKGEYVDGETALEAARREFREELGLPAPDGVLVPLGDVRASGKTVTIWAIEGEVPLDDVVPGTFTMQWPPHSGRYQEFPELDRVEWFDLDTAREKLVKGQRAFLDRLGQSLG